MSAASSVSSSLPASVPPPSVAPLELARLRGSVRGGLFGGSSQPPRVGRYELLRCVGRGGMGIVYAARDVELGREVAIKILRPELSGEDQQGGWLTSEARALARLSHPNVVSVFDVGTFEGQRFIAMEYVAGQELRRWLESPRTLRQVLEVFVGAGRGLAAAHAVGLVHRDFKPDNVLVGEDGRPRVLDFGLARPPGATGSSARPPALPAGVDLRATVLTQAGELVGTPAYMAPEQHLGEPADARSDQFSFAVALYHAVYGVRPFTGEDPQTLALSIVRGRVRPAEPRYPVPAWLEALLERALAVDPAGRHATMEELLAIIEPRLSGAATRELEVEAEREVVDELAPSMSELARSLGEVGPSLSGAELREAWREAGLPDPAPPSPATPPSSTLAPPAQPPAGERAGLVTSISTRRSLPYAVSESTLEVLTRELWRQESRRGRIDLLGSCVTWTTPRLEVHFDVSPGRTQLLVWRRLARSLRLRTVAAMALAGWLSMVVVLGLSDGVGLLGSSFGEIVPFLVIGSMIFSMIQARRWVRSHHEQALDSHRAQVEFLADRLLTLAEAGRMSEGRALPVSGAAALDEPRAPRPHRP